MSTLYELSLLDNGANQLTAAVFDAACLRYAVVTDGFSSIMEIWLSIFN